jgi:hypothetical protein
MNSFLFFLFLVKLTIWWRLIIRNCSSYPRYPLDWVCGGKSATRTEVNWYTGGELAIFNQLIGDQEGGKVDIYPVSIDPLPMYQHQHPLDPALWSDSQPRMIYFPGFNWILAKLVRGALPSIASYLFTELPLNNMNRSNCISYITPCFSSMVCCVCLWPTCFTGSWGSEDAMLVCHRDHPPIRFLEMLSKSRRLGWEESEW